MLFLIIIDESAVASCCGLQSINTVTVVEMESQLHS